MLSLQGPKSRKILQNLTDADLSNEGFPFNSCRYIKVAGGHEVLALRVSFVGEMGWELHIPKEGCLKVYNTLWKHQQKYQIQNVGYRAIESLRLEKGFRYWSTDLTPEINPYEAGLGFCVKLEKKQDFIGKKALEQVKKQGPSQKCVGFTLNEKVPVHGGEAIYHQGKLVGVATSSGYGHTVQKPIVYGYVPSEIAPKTIGPTHEGFEIESMGQRIAAQRFKGALVDPKREKVLA